MRRNIVMVGLAITSLGFAACGGSDGESSGLSDDQQEAASLTIEQAKAEGVELDASCVNGVLVKLSDDDAKAIVAAGVDGAANVSEQGKALSIELIDCADQDAMVDLMISSMKEQGQDFDEACMRDELAAADMGEIVQAGRAGNLPPDIRAALTECAGG